MLLGDNSRLGGRAAVDNFQVLDVRFQMDFMFNIPCIMDQFVKK
jgi:hypothetical protein